MSEHGGHEVKDRFGALAVAGEVLAEAIAERLGTIPDDPRPRLLAGVVITTMDLAYAKWINGGATNDLITILDATFDTLAKLINPGQDQG